MAEYEVCQLLRQRGFDDLVVEIFEKNKIDMDVIKDLNADDMKELGIVALGDRKRLQQLIDSIQPQKGTSTMIAESHMSRSQPVPTGRSSPFFNADSSKYTDHNERDDSSLDDSLDLHNQSVHMHGYILCTCSYSYNADVRRSLGHN